MAWQTPKTDWSSSVDDEGNYTGDYFNASDFNRIKNNLKYLYNLAIELYPSFNTPLLGADKTTSDYFYADEINQFEETLDKINSNTLKRPYGMSTTYVENGTIIDYGELNRIEKAMLDLYNRLSNQANGRRMFKWNFGMGGTF